MDYLLEHDLKLSSPLREQYIKGPGMLLKGNPEKYKTLITAIVKTS
jgi:effector-binding domain-containing protein